MTDLIAQLAAGRRVAEPVLLVVAHPDDETVSTGALLARFDQLTIVQLTDGAPRDLADARREGFADWRDYAAAREGELGCALGALGIAPRRVTIGVPDQQAIDSLGAIVDALAQLVADAAAVVTHPYEHGHPDHDSAALAVALASQRAGRGAHLEFASYHLAQEGARFGRFWPDPGCPEWAYELSPAELARKERAIACFATQRDTLAQFPLGVERLRSAPSYDFTRPAPPGDALYDRFGWELKAEGWRARARSLMQVAA